MAEHRKTHWGTETLYKYLSQRVVAWNLYTTTKQVTQQCEICLQSNPRTGPRVPWDKQGREFILGNNGELISLNSQEKGGIGICWY